MVLATSMGVPADSSGEAAWQKNRTLTWNRFGGSTDQKQKTSETESIRSLGEYAATSDVDQITRWNEQDIPATDTTGLSKSADEGHSLLRNTYDGRGSNVYHQPSKIRAELPAVPNEGPAPSASANIKRFNTSWPYQEGDTSIARNAFGLPVLMRSSEGETSQELTFRYDAFGRMVLKEVPSLIRVTPPVSQDQIIIDVSKPEAGKQKAHYVVSSWQRAKEIINRLCDKREYQGEFLVRLNAWGWDNDLVISSVDTEDEDDDDLLLDLKYKRITIEAAPNARSCHAKINTVHNVTLRGIDIGYLTIKDSAGIVIDGCTFDGDPVVPSLSGVTTFGACPGLQVQNCIFRYENTAIHMMYPTNSTALIIHNRFESRKSNWNYLDQVAVQIDLEDKEELGCSYAILNNIFMQSPEMDGSDGSNSAYRRWQPVQVNLLYASLDKQERNLSPAQWGARQVDVLMDFNLTHLPGSSSSSFSRLLFHPEDHHGDYNGLWVSHRVSEEDVRSGKIGAAAGTADIPGIVSQHHDVVTDRNGILRDPKRPTIGPVEVLHPMVQPTTTYRYVHGDGGVTQREAYRYQPTAINASCPPPDMTRSVSTVAGGPVVHFDSDGQVDVDVRDRDGTPWFLFRQREVSPDLPTALTEGLGSFRRPNADKDIRYYEWNHGRSTGLLRPLEVQGSIFLDLKPWHVLAIESDVLLGRRGQRGWDGFYKDRGSLLARDLSWWERLGHWWDNIDWSDPATKWKLLGGAALVVGGFFVSALTFGAGVPIWVALVASALGGGMMAGGISAIAHANDASYGWGDFGKDFGIGAAAGLVSGVGMIAAASGAFGGAVTNAAALAMRFGGYGTRLAVMGAGVVAGGFTHGALSAMAAGQRGWDVVRSGAYGALTGLAFAGVLSIAGAAVSRLGSAVARAGRQTLSLLGRGVQRIRQAGRLLWGRVHGTAEAPRIVRLARPGRVAFDGMEVRGVHDLAHVDEATLRAMAQRGFAAKDIHGRPLVLHHMRQNPAGPIVEIPKPLHKISNLVQHPLGNARGVGLTPEQRAAFDAWRVEYWKARAFEELARRGLNT